MLDFIDIKDDVEPLVAVVEAFTSASSRADRASLLGQLRDQLEKLRAAGEELQAKLTKLHEGDSEDSVVAIEADQAALVLREDESAAAKMLLPRILSLQRYLERNRPAGPRRPGRRLAVHDSSAGSNMTVGGW